jgi:hypothetical protein
MITFICVGVIIIKGKVVYVLDSLSSTSKRRIGESRQSSTVLDLCILIIFLYSRSFLDFGLLILES